MARSQHASGIVTDSETGETIVVTAGGLDDGDSLDSTEILIDNTWIMGKNFLSIFIIDSYSFSYCSVKIFISFF